VNQIFPPPDAAPISDEESGNVLQPFVDAAAATLTDWAAIESTVLRQFRGSLPANAGDVSAAIELHSAANPGLLVVSLTQSAAIGLAGRILAETDAEPDDGMISDCAGEFANLVAGHAKALFIGSPRHFTLGTPIAAAGRNQNVALHTGRTFLAALIGTAVGELALYVDLPATSSEL
jgi:CheY-specific phosphatase CheX